MFMGGIPDVGCGTKMWFLQGKLQNMKAQMPKSMLVILLPKIMASRWNEDELAFPC